MKATARFYVEDRQVAEVVSDQASEETALAWCKYLEMFTILIKDRKDVKFLSREPI